MLHEAISNNLEKYSIGVSKSQWGWSGWLVLASLATFFVGSVSGSIAAVVRRLGATRVFLSYSKEDGALATKLTGSLRKAGAKVWLAPEQVRPGENVRAAVEKAIENADAFVVLLSKPRSKWMDAELQMALKKHKRVIPVIASDAADLPPSIKDILAVDVRNDEDRAIQTLVDAVS